MTWILALLLATPGDGPLLTFAPDYDKALAEAAERGVPLLFLNFDAWATEPWQPWLTAAPFAKSVSRAVVLISSQEEHGDKVEVIDGSPRNVCRIFGQVTCLQHRNILERLFQEFVEEGGSLITPHFFIVSPERKILHRAEHEFTPDAVTTALDDAMRQFPHGLDCASYLKVRRCLAQAEVDIGSRLFEDGVPRLREALDLAGQSPMRPKAEALCTKLEQFAREILVRADASVEKGNVLEALVALDDLVADLERFAPVEEARARERSLLDTPAGRELRKELKDHGDARALFRQARANEKAGKTKLAIQALRKIVTRYGKTAFGERAALRLEQLGSKAPPREPMR
ncbi:MAG: tetratricopeptide repeat protein [Planctomycetota bacterium]